MTKEDDEIVSMEIRNWINDELTIQVCRDYYPFPQTQPKFHLGQLVRNRNFDRPGVVIAIASDCPALEWSYLVRFSNCDRSENKEFYESDLCSEKLINQ